MGSVTFIGVRQRSCIALMVVAVGVAAWMALDGEWLAVVIGSAALAPASHYRQFERYEPEPRGTPVLRFALALLAAILVILAAAAA
jgi:hypothetical protein